MRRYPGLSPFTTEEKDLFFGRDNDIKQLSKLIFVERKVLLYSKSGYGKTSLLNAGVIPELEKNKNFEFIKVRFRSFAEGNKETPDSIFLATLKQQPDFKENSTQNTNKPEGFNSLFQNEYNENYWTIFKRKQFESDSKKTYIFIFDQFEELFTYPSEQVNVFKQKFAEVILTNRQPKFFHQIEDQLFENNADEREIEKLYNPLNLKAVFSMRSDRLSELNNLADEISDIQKVFYELLPLNKVQAEQAIINPAKQEGNFESQPFTYQKPALEKIINALAGKGKIETTQLQIVCQRIEENIIAKKNLQGLTVSSNDIPDFKDIFLNFYNNAVSKITTDNTDKVRKFVEDQLIIEGRRISLDENVCKKHVYEETLKTLVETRLLRAERNTVEGISYELSHDTLVPPIKEIADQRREREKKEEEERIRQEELRIEREKRKRQRKIILIVSIAAVLSVAFAIFGFVMWQKAEKQTILAFEKTEIANQKEKEAKVTLNKLKISEFNKLSEEANRLCKDLKYAKAVAVLDSAFKWTNDSTTLQNRRDSLLKTAGKEIEFERLMQQADALAEAEKTYLKAIEIYRQASQIDFDDKSAIVKINALQAKFNNRLSYYKTKASEYIKKGEAFKENALNFFIIPGLELNPGDKELLRLEKEAKLP